MENKLNICFTYITGKKRKRTSDLWLHRPKKCRINSTEDVFTPRPTFEKDKDSALQNAPQKTRNKKSRIKRKLYGETVEETIIREMTDILPSVLNKLKNGGIMGDFVNLLKLIHEGKLPLTNIAFLLFLDVVRWYSLDNTVNMTYSDQAIKFWRVMYRLFHGKALRFMGGLRKEDEESEPNTNRGGYSPDKSSINFAVPSQRKITSTDLLNINLPKELPPGIIKQALEMKSKEKSYILSCDGKKLAPGLNEEWGDQDLFGHEEYDSLSTLQNRLKDEVENIEELRLQWDTLADDEKVKRLETTIKMVSLRIKDLRMLYVNQTKHLKRFMKQGGQNWKTTKYVYAISSIQALLHQIRSVAKKLLDINTSLLLIGSNVNNTLNLFSQSDKVDVYSQSNLYTLKDVEDLPESLCEDIRFTKQRTSKWHEVRDKFKLTGSTIFAGLGLDTLKLQQRHYDKVVRKQDIPEILTEEAKKRMAHGTESEIHAIATLTSKVMPFYHPGLVYVEEGAHEVYIGDSPCLLISPDGSLRPWKSNSSVQPDPVLACEFKAPSPADYKTPVHYQIPVR